MSGLYEIRRDDGLYYAGINNDGKSKWTDCKFHAEFGARNLMVKTLQRVKAEGHKAKLS